MARPLPRDIGARWERCLEDTRRAGVQNPYAVCTAAFKRAYGQPFLRWRAAWMAKARRRRYANPTAPDPRTHAKAPIRRSVASGIEDALSPYYSRPRALARRLGALYEALNQTSIPELYAKGRSHGVRSPHDFGHLLAELSMDPRLARRLPFEIRVPAIGWDVHP